MGCRLLLLMAPATRSLNKFHAMALLLLLDSCFAASDSTAAQLGTLLRLVNLSHVPLVMMANVVDFVSR